MNWTRPDPPFPVNFLTRPDPRVGSRAVQLCCDATAVTFSVKYFNPLKLYPLSRKHCFALYFFIYSRAFNNNVISNGKFYCCNDTFTDVRFTLLLLLATNILKEYKLFYAIRIIMSLAILSKKISAYWLLFLRVMQVNTSGCFFLNTVYMVLKARQQ